MQEQLQGKINLSKTFSNYVGWVGYKFEVK
jgi:hypothetical protein